MVPGAEQDLPPPVPDREGKIAQESLGAALAPTLVSAEDQLAVCDLPARTAGEAKSDDELLAIIDAGVGCEDEDPIDVRQRQLLLQGFRRRVEHPVSETGGPLVPCTRAVRPPMGDAF